MPLSKTSHPPPFVAPMGRGIPLKPKSVLITRLHKVLPRPAQQNPKTTHVPMAMHNLPVSLVHSSLSTMVSLVLLRQGQLVPATEHLHFLCLLPRIFHLAAWGWDKEKRSGRG